MLFQLNNLKELNDSLFQPKTLIEQIFQSLSLKGSNFKIFQPSTNISAYSDELTKAFKESILSLDLRRYFTKTKYPKFFDFYTEHCVNRKYHFHVLMCLQPDCEQHSPIKSGKIEPFREPVPEESPNSVTNFLQDNHPTEKLVSSRLEDPSKRNHDMPFTPCYVKLIYKMSPRMIGTQILKLPNWYFAGKIFHVALLLIPYISCIRCGQSSALLPDTPEPFSKRCETKACIKKTT